MGLPQKKSSGAVPCRGELMQNLKVPVADVMISCTVNCEYLNMAFSVTDKKQADDNKVPSKHRRRSRQSPEKSTSRSPLRNTTQDSNVRRNNSVEFREPLASYRQNYCTKAHQGNNLATVPLSPILLYSVCSLCIRIGSLAKSHALYSFSKSTKKKQTTPKCMQTLNFVNLQLYALKLYLLLRLLKLSSQLLCAIIFVKVIHEELFHLSNSQSLMLFTLQDLHSETTFS